MNNLKSFTIYSKDKEKSVTINLFDNINTILNIMSKVTNRPIVNTSEMIIASCMDYACDIVVSILKEYVVYDGKRKERRRLFWIVIDNEELDRLELMNDDNEKIGMDIVYTFIKMSYEKELEDYDYIKMYDNIQEFSVYNTFEKKNGIKIALAIKLDKE